MPFRFLFGIFQGLICGMKCIKIGANFGEEERMNQTEQKIRNKITLLTFICSLLVIWIHTFNLELYGIDAASTGVGRAAYFLENYWKNVTNIAVPLFFFISGFLFFRTYDFGFQDTIAKYKSRVKSIGIPYICWCTIYYLFFVVITSIPAVSRFLNGAEKREISVIAWLRCLGPEKYYTLWFLQNLILFIVLCPVLYLVLKNRKKIPVGTIVLLAGILNVYFKWISLPAGLIEYAAGAWVAINYKNIIFYCNKYISIIAWVYIAYLFGTGFRWYGLISELLLFAALWYALDCFSLEREFPWWMKITFFTYVAHDLVLEVLEKLLLIALGRQPIWALATYIFVPVMVFLVLVVAAMLLKRCLPRVWKVLTGAR